MAILDSDPEGGGGSTSSSSGSGGSSSSGGSVPSWVWNPRGKILAIVASWIAAGFYQMSVAGVDLVQTVQGWYFAAFGAAGDGILGAFRGAGNAVLGVEDSITRTLVDIGMSSGFAGPLVAGFLFMVVMVASAVAMRWLLNAVKWIT